MQTIHASEVREERKQKMRNKATAIGTVRTRCRRWINRNPDAMKMKAQRAVKTIFFGRGVWNVVRMKARRNVRKTQTVVSILQGNFLLLVEIEKGGDGSRAAAAR
jgi:hypothetical protein